MDLSKIKQKIYEIHGDVVSFDETTYVAMKKKAKFIDKDFGEWWQTPCHVIYDKTSHPKRRGMKISEKLTKLNDIELAKKLASKNRGECLSLEVKNARTMLRWKCESGHEWEQNLNHIFYSRSWCPSCKHMKTAKTSASNFSTLKHWKTNDELICQGSWEPKVVEYFNKNKIDFEWQLKTFKFPVGKKTYRPDAYLVNENKWIEIKGYFRKDAQEKWDWFHKEYPNSELWDEKKLKEMRIL